MKTTAVIVTYNRLKLLQKSLERLRTVQGLDHVIVVNNGSTDSTGDWLSQQQGITVITQENVGGSGGFHTGMQHAYDMGYDYIWCMDDDVFPEPETLQRLLAADAPEVGILCPRRIQQGKVFVNECRKVNMRNPFASMHQQKLTAEVLVPVDIMGMVFEGPLVKRAVIEKVGLPNKGLFIFYDDTDYSYRAVLGGFRVLYVPDALLDKELFWVNDTWEEKQRKKKWKRMYQIRNAAYFDHHYGRNVLVRYARPFNMLLGYLLVALFSAPFSKAYSWSDVSRFWRAYCDGIHERLGKMQM